MVCESSFPGYFEAVFENGGDPNLVNTDIITETPIFKLVKWSGNREKIKYLVEKGADLNYVNGADMTPPRVAVARGNYGLCLFLLELGADHTVYKPRINSRLIHAVVSNVRRSKYWSEKQRSDYETLVKWLIDHGESVEDAQKDIDRWRSLSISSGEYKRITDAEVAKRLGISIEEFNEQLKAKRDLRNRKKREERFEREKIDQEIRRRMESL